MKRLGSGFAGEEQRLRFDVTVIVEKYDQGKKNLWEGGGNGTILL